MKRNLLLHPATPCDAITQIEVDVDLTADHIVLRYEARGAVGNVLIPALASSLRTDRLWQHTCFESFVRAGERYCEFNFSPSTEWAAYRFDGYRSGMQVMEDVSALPITLDKMDTSLLLQATLPRVVLAKCLGDGPPKLGLCAVIEEKNSRKSYWALRHPPGKPDFHHADCFALELPRISTS